MKYRRFTTVGELREKRKDRKETVGCLLILTGALILFVVLLYLLSPDRALLNSTALCGVSYRQLILIMMLTTAIFITIIGVLAANKGTPFSYYLKTLG